MQEVEQGREELEDGLVPTSPSESAAWTSKFKAGRVFFSGITGLLSTGTRLCFASPLVTLFTDTFSVLLSKR